MKRCAESTYKEGGSTKTTIRYRTTYSPMFSCLSFLDPSGVLESLMCIPRRYDSPTCSSNVATNKSLHKSTAHDWYVDSLVSLSVIKTSNNKKKDGIQVQMELTPILPSWRYRSPVVPRYINTYESNQMTRSLTAAYR